MQMSLFPLLLKNASTGDLGIADFFKIKTKKKKTNE
jgi:hypothetical protein